LDIEFDAKANITSSAVTSTITSGTAGFDAQANITPSSTVANSVGGTLGFDADANITSSAATATVSAGTAGFDAKANTNLDTTSSSISTSTLDFDAKANITTSSINISTTLVDITTFLRINTTVELSSLLGLFSINLDPPANNLFDYDAHADDYNRTRTVYILPEGGYGLSKTVHLPQQDNNTISLINYSLGLGNVVHINPENFTLTVDKHRALPTTVLITR